jgi:CBS domain-containing protein
MVRVVLERRDPETTEVKDVMTTSVVTISSGAKPDDAVATMWERHIRHLPVVTTDGTVEGIVEIRSLFYERFEDLNREIDSLHAYYAADALGG